MRESLKSGSVEGVVSDHDSYSDRDLLWVIFINSAKNMSWISIKTLNKAWNLTIPMVGLNCNLYFVLFLLFEPYFSTVPLRGAYS